MERKYFKPLSLTWWTGLAQLALGVAIATEPLHNIAVIDEVVTNLTGGIPAYGLISAGLTIIGLRGANG